jgi:hypothetical protein
MNKSKVLGYSNRETYQMANWLMSHDEYGYWSGYAIAAKEEKLNKGEQVFILKHKIDEHVHRIFDNITDRNSIVREGLNRVNWKEIAEEFLERIED